MVHFLVKGLRSWFGSGEPHDNLQCALWDWGKMQGRSCVCQSCTGVRPNFRLNIHIVETRSVVARDRSKAALARADSPSAISWPGTNTGCGTYRCEESGVILPGYV